MFNETNRMPKRSPKAFDPTKVDAVTARLSELKKQKPPAAVRTARDALEQHWATLLSALFEAGWSYADIAREITDAGVSIKADTLRAYWRDEVQKREARRAEPKKAVQAHKARNSTVVTDHGPEPKTSGRNPATIDAPDDKDVSTSAPMPARPAAEDL